MLEAPRDFIKDFSDACINGDLHTVKALLKTPVIQTENIVNIMALSWAGIMSNQPHVVEHLLRVRGIRSKAASEDNYVLRHATTKGYLEVANHLLSVQRVCKNLERKSQKSVFLNIFKSVLKAISGNDRSPQDYEINVVNILRDIAKKHEISYSNFTSNELSALERARTPIDISLFSILSGYRPLEAALRKSGAEITILEDDRFTSEAGPSTSEPRTMSGPR